jgi:PAS domain S-box-containing protein
MPPAATEPISVLLVDDDSQLLRTLADILKRRGYDPQVATSGHAGLALARQGTMPAIALVDLRLPDMDGLEVIAGLRHLSTLTETVILTGHASVDSAVRALREQSHDYLVKPVAPDQLLSTLERASERWRRRQAEEALRQAEERSLLLLENISEIVAVIDQEGTMRYVSPSFRRVLDRDADHLLKESLVDLVHPDDRAAALELISGPLASPGSRGAIEIRALHGNGTWRSMECLVTNLVDRPAVGGFLLSARDVTDARRFEAQVRQAQKMETVGNLAGGMAHDFNNVLTAVIGYSELLLANPEITAEARADVEEIRKAGERASHLTRHLLAFARSQPTEPRLMNVNEHVGDLARMLQRLIGEHISLEVNPAPLNAMIRADPSQFDQVLMNLAVNGRDAMGENGTLTVAIENLQRQEQGLDGVPAGDYVRVTVSDTGAGMPEEVRTRAFEPFFTTKEAGKGTGLGLSTCYGIVQQAGGAISIDSELGRGTSVHTWWPRAASGTATAPSVRRTPVSFVGSERILVVDDDPAVRQLTSAALQRQGYAITVCANGDAAIGLLESGEPFDLLLTDIVLPGVGGQELARLARKACPAIRVLFMSGYDKTWASTATRRPGPTLTKPFTPAELTARIRAVLDEEQ